MKKNVEKENEKRHPSKKSVTLIFTAVPGEGLHVLLLALSVDPGYRVRPPRHPTRQGLLLWACGVPGSLSTSIAIVSFWLFFIPNLGSFAATLVPLPLVGCKPSALKAREAPRSSETLNPKS